MYNTIRFSNWPLGNVEIEADHSLITGADRKKDPISKGIARKLLDNDQPTPDKHDRKILHPTPRPCEQRPGGSLDFHYHLAVMRHPSGKNKNKKLTVLWVSKNVKKLRELSYTVGGKEHNLATLMQPTLWKTMWHHAAKLNMHIF